MQYKMKLSKTCFQKRAFKLNINYTMCVSQYGPRPQFSMTDISLSSTRSRKITPIIKYHNLNTNKKHHISTIRFFFVVLSTKFESSNTRVYIHLWGGTYSRKLFVWRLYKLMDNKLHKEIVNCMKSGHINACGNNSCVWKCQSICPYKSILSLEAGKVTILAGPLYLA